VLINQLEPLARAPTHFRAPSWVSAAGERRQLTHGVNPSIVPNAAHSAHRPINKNVKLDG
jgi:hypothetical protein